MNRVVVWVIALGVAGVMYIMPGMVESSIPSIYYVTPDQKHYETVISCTGTVQSDNIHEVYLQSAAVPVQVIVRTGDFVEEGQVLLKVEETSAQFFEDGTATLIDNMSGQLDAANLANLDLTALISLYGLSILSGEDVGSQLSEWLGAASGESRSPGTVSGQRLPDGESVVYSPVSGVILEMGARENVPVSAGRPVVTIFDGVSFSVLAMVSENDIAKVQVGCDVKVRCVGSPGNVYHGVVSRISPTARKAVLGSSTETVVDVEIKLTDGDETLKPGFTARVEIAGGQDYNLITIPYEAIRQDENNDEYVYIYDDGKISKRLVMTGQEMTDSVEILQGLDQDSIVIYNPGDVVREGAMIQLKGRANVA